MTLPNLDTAPASPEEIAECERTIGTPIPGPYRSFLLRHDGGVPEPYTFDWTTENGRRLGAQVESFLNTRPSGDDSLCHVVRMYRARVPADLFPIASEVGGNLILLGAQGSRAGKIFYWDHNWEAGDDESVTDRNVHPLADSFEAFLRMLRESD